MNKLLALTMVIVVAFSSMAVAAAKGPAPNSDDGIFDGSGFDPDWVPNGSTNGIGHGEPAPNSGDGVPDGPGW